MLKIGSAIFKIFIGIFFFAIFAFAETTYIEQANQLYKSEKYKEATEIYLKVISENPASIKAHRGYVKTRYKQGLIDNVISMYKDKVRENPNNYIYRYTLGYAYGYQQNFDKAINQLKQVVSSNPDLIYAYLSLGWNYKKKDMIEDSIKYYKKAWEINPREVVAIKALSFLYSRSGQYDKALKFSKKAIKLEPENKIHYYNLGVAFTREDNLDNAIEAFKDAIKLDPQFKRAHYNLALVYADNKDSDKAIGQAKEVLLLNPNAKDIHYILGNMYYDKKMYEDAVKEYKTELKNSPHDIDCIFNLGQALSKIDKGKFKEILGYYERAISSDPDFSERAVNYYKKVLLSDSKLVEIRKAHLGLLYLIQAESYFEKEDMCKGATFMENALELWGSKVSDIIDDEDIKDLALSYLTQAKKHLEDDNVDKTEFLTEKALQLMSRMSEAYREKVVKSFAEVYYIIGSVYYDKGLNSEAVRAFKRAIKLDSDFDEVEEAKELIKRINLREQAK